MVEYKTRNMASQYLENECNTWQQNDYIQKVCKMILKRTTDLFTKFFTIFTNILSVTLCSFSTLQWRSGRLCHPVSSFDVGWPDHLVFCVRT